MIGLLERVIELHRAGRTARPADTDRFHFFDVVSFDVQGDRRTGFIAGVPERPEPLRNYVVLVPEPATALRCVSTIRRPWTVSENALRLELRWQAFEAWEVMES